MNWRPFPGFEASHEVSELGLVRRVATAINGKFPQPLKTWICKRTGYPMVTIWRQKTKRNLSVHRAILLAFRGAAPPGRPWALHRDGDPTNSVLDNLYWGSPKENQADCARHGRRRRGTDVVRSKLSDDIVQQIRAACRHGEPQRVVAARHGVHQATVHRVIAAKSWAHVPGRAA